MRSVMAASKSGAPTASAGEGWGSGESATDSASGALTGSISSKRGAGSVSIAGGDRDDGAQDTAGPSKPPAKENVRESDERDAKNWDDLTMAQKRRIINQINDTLARLAVAESLQVAAQQGMSVKVAAEAYCDALDMARRITTPERIQAAKPLIMPQSITTDAANRVMLVGAPVMAMPSAAVKGGRGKPPPRAKSKEAVPMGGKKKAKSRKAHPFLSRREMRR